MQADVQWAPLLLFLSALGAYALIAHLRRPKAARRRRGFRSMKSPSARARRRAQRNVSKGSSELL